MQIMHITLPGTPRPTTRLCHIHPPYTPKHISTEITVDHIQKEATSGAIFIKHLNHLGLSYIYIT